MTDERDLGPSLQPLDVMVGPDPTHQVVLVEAYAAQGIMGPPGPPGPVGPVGELPTPAPGDLGKVPIVRTGPAWLVDMIQAADVGGLGALAVRDTVDTAHIVDAAVTAAKLAAGAVLQSLGYTPADVAKNLSDLLDPVAARTNLGLHALAVLDAVNTPQIVDASVTGPKLAAGVAAGNLGYVPLNKALNLSDVADVPTSRTNLGLKTAALQDIGTSGATVPLNSTANVFSATQTFSGAGASGTEFNGAASLTNTAAYAAGAAATMRFVPSAGNFAARFGAWADSATGSGLIGYVSDNGSGRIAFKFDKSGALNLTTAAYSTPGLLQTDASGNVSTGLNINAPTTWGGTLSVSFASLNNPVRGLSITNTAAVGGGNSADINFTACAGGAQNRISAYLDGAAGSIGMRLTTYAAGAECVALQLTSGGGLKLGGAPYLAAGLLQTDASGNVSTSHTVSIPSSGAVTNPLLVQNTAGWAAGQGAEFRITPTSGSTGAVFRSVANAAATDADMELFVYQGAVARLSLLARPDGSISFPAYSNPGVLTNDATGLISSTPFSGSAVLWTPTVVAGTYSIAYALRQGRTYRIGKLVYLDFALTFTPTGTAGSGTLTIGGFPYPIDTSYDGPSGAMANISGLVGFTSSQIVVYQSDATHLRLLVFNTSGNSSVGPGNLTAGNSHALVGSIMYLTP